MEWMTWRDLKRYKIASIHIGPKRTPLYGVPKRNVVVHLLHILNDFPPMKISFEFEKISGRTVVAAIKNSLTGPKSGITIPVSLVKEIENDNLRVISEAVAVLTQGE